MGRDGANMVPGWCTDGQDDVNINQDGIKVHENGAYEAPNVVQQSDLEIDPTWLKQDFFKMATKRSQYGVKMVPKWAKLAPRWHQGEPRWREGSPRWRQGAPRLC